MAKKQNDGSTVKEERFQWTAKMDEAFIEAMLKEQNEGNRIDGSFTPQAYTNMVNDLTAKLNKDFKKEHLKNRLKTLKDHFSQCYDLFRGVSLSGFAWNSETRLIEAEDEVWDQLINEKPEAAKWKTKEICHYDELRQLFAKDRASGTSAITAKERRKQIENERRIETIQEVDQLLETNQVTLEKPITPEETQGAPTTPLSQLKLPTISKEKKKEKEGGRRKKY
uniref:uncharacterized protein LOC122581605 n=1 Tax=Erigeron canadensis TaxID=72917 RepID=UPI001CB92B53|nr:uncharacterized protein LOC122581605 [Erigeron canadensis]